MWNKFNSCTNEEESIGGSFLINGLFQVSNEEKDTSSPPNIQASLQNGKIVIAIDKNLLIVDENTLASRILDFESEIKCFTTSKLSELIVCCLANGNIHGFHTGGTPVFNIYNDDANQKHEFIQIIQDNNEYFILCGNGTVFCLKGIDESTLTFDAVNTSVSDSTLISNDTLELRKISSFKLNDELYSFCLVDSTMIIIAGQKFLHFINGNEIEQVECPSIKKIVKSDHYILGLTKDGNLINICPFTKTFMKFVKSENIFDFMIFDEDEVHFEIITLSENDHSMAIKDFPSLNKRAEWKMSSLNWLVTLYSSSANLYFISGIESDGNVKTVELRCLTETDPTERLRNLISRGLFNEAEKYAKEFGLSVEPVNQAKVQSLLKNLEQSSSDNETLQTYFDEMMKVMEGIEDKNFFSKLYLNEIPSRSHLSQFLQFILKSIDTSKFINETNEINELLLRLETLRLTDPDECNSQWHKILRHNDMFIVAIDHFKIDVMQSCLIFSRHSSSILNNLNMTKFHKWMDRIPPAVDPFLIVQWMKHFLPCFLQFYPEQMTFITDWCLKRTQSLQFSSAWPEIGLEFIKSSYEILSNMNFLCSNIERLYHCNIEKIQNLIFLLEEITVLKTNFHLIVTLDHYKQSSLHQNALYLLQRVQINNLARIVTDFIYPLFTEIGQTPEQTIFEYIQFLCNNKCIGFWQNRAVIAINLLSNEELKLQAALNVLKISPVPWSDTVYPLVKMGKTSCHPLANLIFIEYKTQAIKIIKLKYGWPVDFLDLQQDRIKLVFRILKVANDDMIKDVQTLVESSSDIAHEAYFHLIYKLLELNRLDEIMDVIEFIEKTVETSKMLFETTIDTLINLVKDKTDNNEFCENAVEIIKILFNRIEWDDLNEMKYQKKIKQFTSTLKLKKSFGEQIENIEDESELLKTCVHEITSKLSDDKEIVPEIVNKCNFLSSCLEQNSTACFTKVLDQLKNHFVSCNVTDQFLDNIESLKKDEIPDSLNLLVTIISQLMKFIENNSLDNLPQSDPLVFPICYKLITKCLQNSNISNYDEIVDLMNWIRIGRNCYPHDIIESTREERSKINFSLNSSKKPSNKRESLSIFEVSHFEPKNSPVVNDGNVNLVIQCLLNAMKLICIMSINKSQFFSKLLSEMNLENESSQKIKNDFFQSLEILLKHKEYRAVVKIIQYLTILQNKENNLIIPATFVSTMNKKIMKYILSQKDPNYMDAFRIFRTEIVRDESIEYLRSSMSNNSQKIAFSNFLEMYNKYVGNTMSVNDERENRLKFYYFGELCKYDSSLRAKNFDTVGIKDLLKDLETRQLSVELVRKLSKDYGWDYQKALIQQLKICLRNQQIEYEVKNDVFGNEELSIISTEDHIRKKCENYVKEITDVHLLAKEMQNFFKEINFYNYEMYLYVLEFIEFAPDLTFNSTIYRNILILLQRIMVEKRRGIEQLETNLWMQTQAIENSMMPAISKYRIPFKPFIDMEVPEELLGNDLRVENFEKFIPLISLHSSIYNEDADERVEICAFKAVKTSVMERKSALSEQNCGTEWNLKSSNNAALLSVLRMASLIKDKSKRLAIIYFHVNHTAPGSDQVEAAFECWKFATSYEEEILQSQKYAELVEKIKRKYPIFKAQHLLHLHGLNEDNLMQLVEDPIELITTLYHHNSILEPSQKKDINKLCYELAELFDIDLESLQMKILQKWLVFSRSNGASESFESNDANDTIYEDFMGSSMEAVEAPKEENVIRAYYLLKSWDKNTAMSFLSNELTPRNENSNNQLQIYECFVKLVDNQSESFAKLIDQNYFLLVKCCSYLKQLGFNMSPAKFKDIDKIEMLKKLWVNNFNNVLGLETMTFICVGFNIFTPQIWSGILKQMIALKMTSNLLTLVEILSSKSQLLHLESLRLAWEFIIKEPFLKTTTKNRSNDAETFSKSFLLLQKCPISTFLNFENLIEICLRLERPHMAAIFLAYVNESDRVKFIDKFSSFNQAKLQREIISLEEIGIAPVITKSVCHILNL